MNNLLGTALEGWNDEPDSDGDSDEDSVPVSDIEQGKRKGIEQPPLPNYMDHFFRDIDNIKSDVNVVTKATVRIQELHERALSTTTPEEEAQLSAALKPLIQETNQRAKKSKTLLGLLKEETKKLQEEGSLNASDVRVRENLTTTVTRKFVDEMKLYQQAQQNYKTAIKSRAKRQIKAIQPDMSDEQVDDVLKTEGGHTMLLKQAVLSNSVNDQVQTAYAKVAGKYQDVLTLEHSVAELHQMFLDFALLTEQQGELLDTIEFQVREANDHVELANEEVFQAIEYQKAIRKKQCWIIGIVVGVGCVIAMVVFG